MLATDREQNTERVTLISAETTFLPGIKQGADIPLTMDPLASVLLLWSKLVEWLFAHLLVLHLAGLTLALALMTYLFPTTVTGLTLNTAPETPVSIPVTFSDQARAYTFEGTLDVDWRPSTRHLTMRADDVVEMVSVDGRVIYRQASGGCASCTPFKVDLPKTVAEGKHDIVVRIRNLGGLGLFDLRQAHGFGWGEGGLALAAALGWLWVVRRRKMSMWAWWVVVAAILLGIGYHLATDPWLRQHDLGGHQPYIQFVQNNMSLPLVKMGWETHQPPLYYAASVVWILLGSFVTSLDRWQWVQWLAWSAYIATIALAVLSWNKFGLPRESGWMGLALLALLPVHLFLSAATNNDVLLPLWGTITIIFLWKYAVGGRTHYLWLLSLCLVLAMMTKTSGIILVAGSVIFVFWRHVQQKMPWQESLIQIAIIVVPSLVWLSLWGFRNWEQTGSLFFMTLPGESQRVANSVFKYLSFDYHALATELHFYTYGGHIRESIPTSLVASAVSGEYHFGYLNFPLLSFYMAAFIPVTAMFVAGILFISKSANASWVMAASVVVSAVVFFVAYNWQYPFACNQDARYLAPAFSPLALLSSWGYGAVMQRLTGLPRLLVKVSPLVFFVLLGAFYFYLIVP